MAYGATREEAVRKAKAIALQVLADMIESGEELPEPFKLLFAARPRGVNEGQARLHGSPQDWLDPQETGRLPPQASASGLARLHIQLSRREEIGPAALARTAKDTGLQADDL